MEYQEKDCIFEHEGKKFESGGAFVNEVFLVAYLSKNGILSDWHGLPLGTYRILSTWRTPRSFVSSTMNSVECFVHGVRYVGRSCGVGMVIRAKRSPKQPKEKKLSNG
jgi:hypothetical protein